MRRPSRGLLLLPLLVSLTSLGQAPADRIEEIPDPSKLAPAELTYVNPLYRPIDVAPKLVNPPPPADFEGMATLVVAVKLDELGRATETQAVEPPVNGLIGPLELVAPKWRFTPAKKNGRPVSTWATFGIDLKIELEKATFTSFSIHFVTKDEPLVPVLRDAASDRWMERYPKEITPPEPGVVSIEDVDVQPAPDKVKWDLDDARFGSRLSLLLEVSSTGAIKRFVPVGTPERLVVAWIKKTLPTWKLIPAQEKGKPVDCWVVVETTIEYTLASAKEKGRRMIRKNLRGTPLD